MTLNPQPKQVWSEEDREMLDNCLGLIQEIDSTQEEQNWLKSLKPNHWKPSDEQLKSLWDAIIYVEGCHSNFRGGRVLELLYNELKQL